MIQLTNSNETSGNGSGEYQPSKTYEHIERDLWAEVNEETGEANFKYELLEEFEDEEDTGPDN